MLIQTVDELNGHSQIADHFASFIDDRRSMNQRHSVVQVADVNARPKYASSTWLQGTIRHNTITHVRPRQLNVSHATEN